MKRSILSIDRRFLAGMAVIGFYFIPFGWIGLPIALTALKFCVFFFLVIATAAGRNYISQACLNQLVAVAVASLTFLTYINAVSAGDALHYSLRFVYKIVLPTLFLIYFFSIYRKESDLLRFMEGTLASSVLLSFFVLFFSIGDVGGRVGFYGTTGPISSARLAGYGALVAIILLFIRRHSLYLWLALFMTLCVFKFGSRGPFLSFSLCLLLFLGVVKPIAFRYTAPMLATALLLMFLYLDNTRVVSYISYFVTADFDKSLLDQNITKRLDLYQHSLHVFLKNPLGTGATSTPYGNYPHNMVLEFFLLIGVFTLPVLLVFLGFLCKHILSKNPISVLLAFPLLFWFLNSLWSFDIPKNEYTFIFFALLLSHHLKRFHPTVYGV